MLLLSRFVIRGHSMEPTFPHGTTVLASGIPYLFSSPKGGDLVVFFDKKSDKTFIKRIESVDGERYFLRGDNKGDSFDSRRFGWVDKKNLLGKVLCQFAQYIF